MPRPAAGRSNAMCSSPSTSAAGSIGRRRRRIGMDFNPTYFAHPLAADGYTLAHPDEKIRRFWIDHGIACRRIGAAIGQAPGRSVHHQRLDPRRLQGPAHRPHRARASGWPSPSTRSSPSRSTRTTTATPSRASSSASARRATSSARTSSISAMPSRGRSCSASTPATTIRPRSSPTRSRPCSRTSTRSCCTSAGASAGTATTS